MSNELKTIHEFDFTLICNYFKGLKRQGPGSPEVTQKALSFTNELSDNARIADIGCGTGGQTMALANYNLPALTMAGYERQVKGLSVLWTLCRFKRKNSI